MKIPEENFLFPDNFLDCFFSHHYRYTYIYLKSEKIYLVTLEINIDLKLLEKDEKHETNKS